MITKSLLLTGVAASLAFGPATKASADAGDFIAGAIVGAIVNHAAKQPQKKVYRKSTKTYKKKVSKPRIPATQTGRQIQSSLNYFGFNAGSVDGQLGRKSRDAVSQYQAYLGYAATGQLSSFEQDLLINSYNRAQAGGYATQQMVAANPEGVRGLLKQFRQEMAGGAPVMAGMAAPTATMPQTTMVVAPSQQMAMAPAPVAVAPMPAPVAPAPVAVAPVAVAPTPVAVAPVAPAPIAQAAVTPVAAALPSLFGGAAKPTLSVHCAAVSKKTSENGGFITAATMTDSTAALNEQFCLARQSAIADGAQLAQGLGATPDQINATCAAYGQQTATFVASLGSKPREAVLQNVAGFTQGTGIPSQDLAATAKVCMSVGYRDDNMDQAIGSGLILAAMDSAAFGELMGHHLSQGIGTEMRVDLAAAWYEGALDAAAVQPVFATAQPGRLAVLRKAVGGAQTGGLAPLPTLQPASALPAFSISE
ncbi:peptidoglycan-binding domain-containing protein [Oceaniglobus ichthyenteri]|uniref:peptidoglycan-binding domain-containing protein n=1 Tax=Oceaniglobus ichthyenteri TaxID=2136177 RepID=UPI0013DDDAAC|nr:peptidoglycan-binding domain-containing protein [Oceaniglobus ichthyenteri]